jgi:hypothetical protein
MKQILLYGLLFVAVIGLIFGIFYLIITLKTPQEGIVIEDILDEMEGIEQETVKLDYRATDEEETGFELLLYQGEGYSFEYPDGYDLSQIEVKSGIDKTKIDLDELEEVQLGTLDYYRHTDGEAVVYYTFDGSIGMSFRIASTDLDNSVLQNILESVKFE